MAHELWSSGVVSVGCIALAPNTRTDICSDFSISRLPVAEVIAALWVGKWLKYSIYAWTFSAFPGRILVKIKSRMDVFNAMQAQVSNASGMHFRAK